MKGIGRSSLETMSKSVVISLEGNVNVFSSICVLKNRIVEDVGTGVVEVRLVNDFGWFSKPIREY